MRAMMSPGKRRRQSADLLLPTGMLIAAFACSPRQLVGSFQMVKCCVCMTSAAARNLCFASWQSQYETY